MATPEKNQPDLRSFQEWSDAGYRIIKGQQHVSRRHLEGGGTVPLFSVEQVAPAFGRMPPIGGDPFDGFDDDDPPVFSFADTQDSDPFDDIPM